MKAVLVEQAGGAEALHLAEIEMPKLDKPNQVLIRLKAAGLNPIDYKVRQALDRFPVTLPAVLGCDGAGVVEAVGEDVERFQAGDQVYFCQAGFNGRQGTYAEYAVVDEALVAHKPKSLDFHQAAAVPLVLLTAWEALFDRVQLQNRMKVLVQAGAGGVGHIAIQLAKLAGAEVATTISTQEKEDFVRRLSADFPIRYREADVVDEIRAWTGGEGVDIVFDTVGDRVFSQSCACCRVYGELVTILLPPPEVDWTDARVRNLQISLEMMLTPVLLELPEWQAHQGHILKSAAELFDQNKLEVQVAKTFPLAEAAEAQRYLETQAPLGKVVLTID
ncbi:zinc-dependent alcohol dehydrogenase family protein [Methylohalobius crimeensis]|uniref:zinc-dependent alcohol dehydrogenase family protein n=1 Tax=Methylohalobius crimeensis TaxID=244365 RepID=UPI0003B3582C|nr:zinc-dependent alcohol dehydrogenase family protein [Methylohalobius crimeensis]